MECLIVISIKASAQASEQSDQGPVKGVADSGARAWGGCRVTEADFVEAALRAVDKLNALRVDEGLQRELVALGSSGQAAGASSLEAWLGLEGVL